MKKVIIFGIGDSAELAKYYLENDVEYKNKYSIEGFCIDRKFKSTNSFLGKPLIAFEDIEKYYPSNQYYLFNTLGYSKINTLREEKYKLGKEKGYKYINYISSKAIVLGEIVGENNFIEEGVIIQPYVKIGNNNVIRYGSKIGHHTKIEDNCFLAPSVSIAGRVLIKNNCFLGVNSTIFNHLVLEEKTLIGGGVILKKDTKKEQVVIAKNDILVDKKSMEIKI